MDAKAKELLTELTRGVELAFENAEQLYREGEILRKKKAHSRSLLLHQMSLEECGKIDIIGGWAMTLVLGKEIDFARMAKAFRSHESKNYANSYYATASAEERQAKERGDNKAAVEAFKKLQEQFHKDSNTAKNASIYVDFIDGRFVSPSERITEQLSLEIAAVNLYFLQLTAPKVRMVKGLGEDAAKENVLKWVVTEFEKLRGAGIKDVEDATSKILEEMFERYRKEKRD